MTSPLAPFANARLAWTAPGTRTSGRDGFVLTAGQSYLITAFLKRRSLPGLGDERMNLPAINGAVIDFVGYTVAFAPITAEQMANFSTIDLSTLTFDDSALLPPGVHRDDKGKLFVAGLGVLEVHFSDKAGEFGELGIGEITRGVLGDPLYLVGGQVG